MSIWLTDENDEEARTVIVRFCKAYDEYAHLKSIPTEEQQPPDVYHCYLEESIKEGRRATLLLGYMIEAGRIQEDEGWLESYRRLLAIIRERLIT